jgi:predicted ArsR family transcriptional regulator
VRRIGLSPAAIRRHLDAMLADGDVIAREQHVRASGAGPAAKIFSLTDAGRLRCGPHLRRPGQRGPALDRQRRRRRGGGLRRRPGRRARGALPGRRPRGRGRPDARAEALAEALSVEGYAASASTIATGGQLCQHHCPVAHVAAEFPQLCEAETQVISRLVGTHVQRLATIANGDGVCTTHIPDPRRVRTPRRRARAHRRGATMTEQQTSPTQAEQLARLGRYEYGWADADTAGAGARRG